MDMADGTVRWLTAATPTDYTAADGDVVRLLLIGA